MKTLFFAVTTDLSYDQRMMRICGSLARAGYAVRLIGRRRTRSVPLDERPYEQVRLNCVFQRGKLFYIEHNLRLFFHLLTHRFDLVCAIDLDTILPCFLAAKLTRRPLVYDAHEIFTEIPELTDRPRVRALWLRLESLLVPRAARAYTVNESLADLFHERYGTRFEVIRNVPLLKADAPAPRDVGERYVFYQGVLNAGRGLDELIRAMAGVDCRLLLAGEGDLSDALRRLARELGLADKVAFLGYLKPADLVAYGDRAAIAVNLRAHVAMNDYYSLANKFFDSMHAGVPQITMRFPEYERINARHEVAVLLDDLSVESIRGALVSLLQDRVLYERLRANCLAARAVYNWQAEEQSLLAFYQALFTPSPRRSDSPPRTAARR